MLHFNKLSSTEPFNKAFDKAIKYYLKPNWQKASKYFDKCLVMKPADGPSKSLRDFISGANNDPKVVNFKGYRDLVE